VAGVGRSLTKGVVNASAVIGHLQSSFAATQFASKRSSRIKPIHHAEALSRFGRYVWSGDQPADPTPSRAALDHEAVGSVPGISSPPKRSESASERQYEIAQME
jgi:hypothetical protein